jgi:HAD superfamily hydrolase (TIGR01490 family)
MSAKGSPSAFFDLDGTLVTLPSLERRFIRYLFRRSELGFAHAARWLARFLTPSAINFRGTMEANKAYLAGLRASLADEWARWSEHEPAPFFVEGLRLLIWHAAQGHQIFLVSGTLAPLATGIAKQLLVPATACATELEVRSGRWTGRIRGELISGEAKARAIECLAVKHGLDLESSYGYGDRSADIPMLKSVGHPVAINPSRALKKLASQRGWPALKWHETLRAKTPGFFARPVPASPRIPPPHLAGDQR